MRGKGGERGGLRIQSGLHTDSSEPNVGLKLTNCKIMTWAKVGCSTEPDIQAFHKVIPIKVLSYVFLELDKLIIKLI